MPPTQPRHHDPSLGMFLTRRCSTHPTKLSTRNCPDYSGLWNLIRKKGKGQNKDSRGEEPEQLAVSYLPPGGWGRPARGGGNLDGGLFSKRLGWAWPPGSPGRGWAAYLPWPRKPWTIFFPSLFQLPSRLNHQLPVPWAGHGCGLVGGRALGQVSFMVLIPGCRLAKNKEEKEGKKKGLKISISGLDVNKGAKNDIWDVGIRCGFELSTF